MSGTRPDGAGTASSASRSATSPTAMGCTRTPLGIGTGTTGTLAAASVTIATRSWNCVVRRIVTPSPDSSSSRSTFSFRL